MLMAKNFWKIVNQVIKKSDIVLEILDSRLFNETRNKEIEDKVRQSGKKIIYVINKCDLMPKEKMEIVKKKLKPSVFVSSKERYGITKLLHLILRYASNKDKTIIGVVGYPNTGKSSVINALKGRASASTSPVSGHTKGQQLIKIHSKIYLIDTPGVLPYSEKNETKHVLISSISPSRIKDPDLAVIDLMKKYPGKIENHYKVKKNTDYEKTIANIALKHNKLLKKGIPDIKTMSKKIIHDWQKGIIK